MIISRTFKYMRNIITPLVSGIVVLLIGLSLIKVGIISCGGGYTAMDNGTFASWENLSIAGAVLLSVLFFNRCKNKYLRMSSIVLGLCLGYGLAFVLGKVDMSALNVEMLMSFNIPQPFKYGLDFNVSSFIAIGLVYMITAIEATGDVTANSMISGLKIEGDDYLKRVSGGVMADGFNSFLAGIFNSFPNSIFAQNNGIIQLTGVASRYVGYYIAAMLILLGLFADCGSCFLTDAGPCVRRSYFVNVRNCRSSRNPHCCITKYRTEGNIGIGCQSFIGTWSRIEARCVKPGSGSYS